MINSRDPNMLDARVRAMALQMIVDCGAAGIHIIITSTFRDCESQTALYNQGRTTPGKIVTNARCGFSMHNYRLAFDVVPLDADGKVNYTVEELDVHGRKIPGSISPVWKKVAEIGKACGLEWGGDWTSFKDFPHFQLPGVTTEQLRSKGLPS